MLASSTALVPTYPGVPGVDVLWPLATSSPKFFSKLVMMVDCPNHALHCWLP